MQAVLETDTFSNSAKAIGLTESERHEIATRIGDNPKIGDLIKGTGGARKMRFPRQGRGKSSGYKGDNLFCRGRMCLCSFSMCTPRGNESTSHRRNETN